MITRLTQYMNVTDGRTDGQTSQDGIGMRNIARQKSITLARLNTFQSIVSWRALTVAGDHFHSNVRHCLALHLCP